jgi:hypothetical protein
MILEETSPMAEIGNLTSSLINEKTLEFTNENQGFYKRGRRGSNPQPPDRQSGALTN